MKNALIAAVIIALLVVGPALTGSSVDASATVTYSQLTCSSFFVSGTSTAPFVAVFVFNVNSGVDLINLDGGAVYNDKAVYPVAPDGTFAVGLSFPEQPAGSSLYVDVWGNNLGYAYAWDNEAYYSYEAACDRYVGGPPIPAGFKQHNIVCTSPVYDMPAGQPVGVDRVLTGQDWHVNPTPKLGPDGQYWTEIFVGGLRNPYIPSACVGTPTSWPFN